MSSSSSSSSSSIDTVVGPFASQEYVDGSVGPAIAGYLVQLFLCGIAASQYNIYLDSYHYTTDPKRTRYTAHSTMLFCVVNAALSFWSCYHYATWQARDSASIGGQTPVDAFSTIFVGIEAMIVQIYLGIRAAKLFTSQTNRIIFYVFGGLAAFISLFGSAYYLVLSWVLISGFNPSNLNFQFTLATGLWVIGAAVADVQISVALVFQLLKRIRGFSSSTDSTLRKLIKISVASASYTSVTATIAAVLNFAIPEDSLNVNATIAFFVPLPSMYALALFSNLNARDKLQTRLGDTSKNTKLSVNNILSHPGIAVDLPNSSPEYPSYGNIKGNNFSSYDPTYDSEKLGGRIPYTTSTQIDVDDEARI